MTIIDVFVKRFVFIINIVFVIYFLTGFNMVYPAPEGKSLNPEWMHDDLQGIGMLLRTIPMEDHNTVEELKESLEGEWSIEDDALGFGARRSRFGKGLGYTSIYVDAFSFNGRIGFFEISVYKPREEDWFLMRKDMIETWTSQGGPPFKEDEYKLFFQKRFDGVFDPYYKTVAEELGAQRSVDVPSELKAAYDYLTSPLNNTRVGDGICGLHGPVLEGKRSIDLLIKAKRVDLIENVLRGYNPGGRIYAAIALLRMERRGLYLEPAITETIEKVGALDIPITSCAGCIVHGGQRGEDVIKAFAGRRAALRSKK